VHSRYRRWRRRHGRPGGDDPVAGAPISILNEVVKLILLGGGGSWCHRLEAALVAQHGLMNNNWSCSRLTRRTQSTAPADQHAQPQLHEELAIDAQLGQIPTHAGLVGDDTIARTSDERARTRREADRRWGWISIQETSVDSD
jgi:hypothetical protein